MEPPASNHRSHNYNLSLKDVITDLEERLSAVVDENADLVQAIENLQDEGQRTTAQLAEVTAQCRTLESELSKNKAGRNHAEIAVEKYRLRVNGLQRRITEIPSVRLKLDQTGQEVRQLRVEVERTRNVEANLASNLRDRDEQILKLKDEIIAARVLISGSISHALTGCTDVSFHRWLYI